MAWHAQLKFVMTECSKTQIRLTGLIYYSDGFSLLLDRFSHPSVSTKDRTDYLVFDR